ncbi:MAG TPA: hypothetical protein DCS93_35505 [Microscillaceae bacterium]|nr:hypothetical protein [Microscillaceae bacterium]
MYKRLSILLLFLINFAAIAQTNIAQQDPMTKLSFLVGNKWIIKDKLQQSSNNSNVGEIVFEWALDKRLINFTKYYYLSAKQLRPGTQGTLALNPFSEKIRHFTFSDDGQTTEGIVTQATQSGITLAYDKFLPDGQKMKVKEVYQLKTKDQIEVTVLNWDGSGWQAANTLIWTRNKSKVAYQPSRKTTPSTGKTYRFKSQEWNVPVEFISNPKSTGLKFTAYTSEVNVYRNSYMYSVTGNLKVDKLIISSLELKVELLDKEGKVRFTEKDYAISSLMSPQYRSGDEIPLKILKSIKNQPLVRIAKARIIVKAIKKITAPTQFSPSKKLTITWRNGKPNNIDLAFSERLSNISNAYKPGFYSQKLVLEVKNTGNLALSTITVTLEWLNDQNKVVFSQKRHVSTIINPSVLPDKTHMDKMTNRIPKNKVTNPARYRIVIEEVSIAN